jgi:hypothetical protein
VPWAPADPPAPNVAWPAKPISKSGIGTGDLGFNLNDFRPWSQVEVKSACEAIMRLCFHRWLSESRRRPLARNSTADLTVTSHGRSPQSDRGLRKDTLRNFATAKKYGRACAAEKSEMASRTMCSSRIAWLVIAHPCFAAFLSFLVVAWKPALT